MFHSHCRAVEAAAVAAAVPPSPQQHFSCWWKRLVQADRTSEQVREEDRHKEKQLMQIFSPFSGFTQHIFYFGYWMWMWMQMYVRLCVLCTTTLSANWKHFSYSNFIKQIHAIKSSFGKESSCFQNTLILSTNTHTRTHPHMHVFLPPLSSTYKLWKNRSEINIMSDWIVETEYKQLNGLPSILQVSDGWFLPFSQQQQYTHIRIVYLLFYLISVYSNISPCAVLHVAVWCVHTHI